MRYRVIGRIPPGGPALSHGEWRERMEPVEPYETDTLPEGIGWVFVLLEDTQPREGGG